MSDSKTTLTRFPRATIAVDSEDRTIISTPLMMDVKTTTRVPECMTPRRVVVRVQLEVDVMVDLYTDEHGNGIVGGIPELISDQHPTAEEINDALIGEADTETPGKPGWQDAIPKGFFDLSTIDHRW